MNSLHREWRVDVKRQLMKGPNLLSIVFQPAPDYAKTQAADYPYTVPMQTVSLQPHPSQKNALSG